jgi:hypothetical protein
LTVHLPSVHERSPLLIPVQPASSASRHRSLRSAPVPHTSYPGGTSNPSPTAGGAMAVDTGGDTLSPIPSPNPRYGSTSASVGVSIGISGANAQRLLKRSSTGSFRGVIGSQGGLLLLATPPGSVQRNIGAIGPEAHGHGLPSGLAPGSVPGSRRGSRAKAIVAAPVAPAEQREAEEEVLLEDGICGKGE